MTRSQEPAAQINLPSQIAMTPLTLLEAEARVRAVTAGILVELTSTRDRERDRENR